MYLPRESRGATLEPRLRPEASRLGTVRRTAEFHPLKFPVYRLRDLKPGGEVSVTRANGTEVLFSVDKVEQYPKDAFPTEAVYGPPPDATLRLITCAGPFNSAVRHYRDNLIAFAHLKAT